MAALTRRFPKRWQVDVTVAEQGRDDRGNPVTGPPRTVKGCLFAPSSSAEGADSTDVPDDSARLLAPPGTAIPSTAVITVPGHGTYTVDGTPGSWPLGVDVKLERKGTRT